MILIKALNALITLVIADDGSKELDDARDTLRDGGVRVLVEHGYKPIALMDDVSKAAKAMDDLVNGTRTNDGR